MNRVMVEDGVTKLANESGCSGRLCDKTSEGDDRATTGQ